MLELGNFIAAPTAARLLGDFGADVIKVELPGVGDEIRSWRLPRGDTSMMWRTFARNKRSVTIDLRIPEGAALVGKLADRVDVILENYRPGKLRIVGTLTGVAPRAQPGSNRRSDLWIRADRSISRPTRVRLNC